ncbi:hypothetical protein COLO4_21794 [Corchorus olitorius]|uniref:Uncharacterized protein n=1 Tax=Corchorus olitorius TaxID=93759 RepID=A0A1R3IQS3_9ROSI|nr:hypothetical protein COLO4_21794 [Corchorus olitorius]
MSSKASFRDPLTRSNTGFLETRLQMPRTILTRMKFMASRSQILTVGWGCFLGMSLLSLHSFFLLNEIRDGLL